MKRPSADMWELLCFKSERFHQFPRPVVLVDINCAQVTTGLLLVHCDALRRDTSPCTHLYVLENVEPIQTLLALNCQTSDRECSP